MKNFKIIKIGVTRLCGQAVAQGHSCVATPYAYVATQHARELKPYNYDRVKNLVPKINKAHCHVSRPC